MNGRVRGDAKGEDAQVPVETYRELGMPVCWPEAERHQPEVTMQPLLERTVVVLPTYNEAANISFMIRAILELVIRPDVLVVDDGSPDGTGQLVASMADEAAGRVHLLSRPGKTGLGSAYREGLTWALAAGYDVIVQMDADGSHPPEAITALVAALHEGADVAVGSRYVNGGSLDPSWPWRRKMMSRVANLYARSVLGVGCRDMTGGFKAWRSSTLASIDLTEATAMGYGFLPQTKYLAARSGARIVEVGYRFSERRSGSSKMSLGIAWEATLLIWGMRRTTVKSPEVPAPARIPALALAGRE